jgi:hypothetical protein
MYNSENNSVPSGEMSLLKGIAAQVNPNFSPDRGNKTQLTGSWAEKMAVQAMPGYRDKKLDNLEESVLANKYGGEKGHAEVTQARQDKICEAIAIMRMAASEATWLNIKRDKYGSEGETKPGSKTRDQIITTVCETVLGEKIWLSDFKDLYGESFAGDSDATAYDKKTKLGTSPERRILLIKAAEQFLIFAKEKPNDAAAQERVSFALKAIDRVAAGKLDSKLDKGHVNHARTEAASLLAGRDILEHRVALEAYFGEKSIGQADKLQVAMDLEVTSLRQAQELASMIKALCEKGIASKLQLALVQKISDGLNRYPTDAEILKTKQYGEKRSDADYLRQESGKVKEKMLKEVGSNLLGAKYASEQVASQALLVMSRAFNKPARVLAKDAINDNVQDEYRGSNMADFSPSVIKAIPSFLLNERLLSNEDDVKLAIILLKQGLQSLVEAKTFEREQEKAATYLEMLVALKQKLPKNQRAGISFTSNTLTYALSTSQLYEPRIGSRILKARERLTA